MNAEGTTRFLRSKTVPLLEIVETCTKLLENDGTVYLPNLKIFIFDLIIDRLTDSSPAFKLWKNSPQVWQLFNRTWTLLSEDQADVKLRNNHFRKIRFIELVVIVFDKVGAQDEQLLNAVFKAIDLIIASSYITIEESSSIDLLKAYIHAISSVKDLDQTTVDGWSSAINHIYQLPYLRVNYKFNKKTTTKFCTECLVPVLNYLTDRTSSSKSSPESKTVIVLVGILTRFISNKDSATTLNQNVKLMLKDENLNSALVLFFYKQVVKAHSRNMEICEELYSTITENEKYSNLAESLLEQLTSANRTMSTGFLQRTYEKEYLSTNASVNWDLLGHLLELDVDLAIDHALDIMNKVPSKYQASIGAKLVSAFVRGREFTKFIEEIWLNAITHHVPNISKNKNINHNSTSKKWTNEEFITIVSKSVDELSTVQISSVLKNLTQVHDEKNSKCQTIPRLLAVVKGLLKSHVQKVEAMKSVLLENENLLKLIQDSWEIRFYLLCLYGSDFQVKREDLVVSASKIPSSYYFYTIFRMKELNEEIADKLLTSVIPKYLTYLLQESNKSKTHLVFNFLERWIVFANNNFDKQQLNTAVELIFSIVDVDRILSYFEDFGYIFFEQKEVVNAFISKLIDILSNRKSAEHFQIILGIPIQCYPKHLKVKLVELTYEVCTSTKSVAHTPAPACLSHLLSQPSFKTKVETDFDALMELLSSGGNGNSDEDKRIVVSICTAVWSAYVHGHSDQKSKEYILSSLQKLSKFFKSFQPKKGKTLPIEFEICIILISFKYPSNVDQEIADSLGEIANQFLNTSTQLLNHLSKSDNYKTINIILDALSRVPSLLNHEVHTTLKRIGSKVSTASSGTEADLVRYNLFKLNTLLLESNFENAAYLLSLYVAIQTQFNLDSSQDLLNCLTDFLQSISEDDLILTHSLLLQTIEIESNGDNIEILIQLLLSFLNKKVLKRTNNKESTTLILVSSLSSIFSRFELIFPTLNQLTQSILETLKTCLSEVYWCFDQYAIETTLSLITKVAQCVDQVSQPIETYILLSQVMSQALLNHRFRLTSRHHLIMSIYISLLEPLSLKKKLGTINDLSSSIEAASAYSRLLGNLCEPSNKTTNSDKNGLLNSSSALIKRALRKHIPVLLVNFISLSLTSHFSNVNSNVILSGVFKIFDVLSPIELQLVSSSLDIPGRTYYKSLYSNYKANGKWKDQ